MATTDRISSNLRISLVIATIGRTIELDRLLLSLTKQTYKNFELIVIDQNQEGLLDNILNKYMNELSILHLKSQPGLSRARNAGLKYVKGDLVAFPDDDCWYPESLLEVVADRFLKSPKLNGLTGRSFNESMQPSAGRFDSKPGLVDIFNVWRRGISYTIFLRTTYNEIFEGFDESLGVGAATPWGSGEETDYLIRLIKSGAIIEYNPSLIVGHPEPVNDYLPRLLNRALSYGAGLGRVLRKHHYPLYFVVYNFYRPIGGIVLSLIKGNVKKSSYHYAVLRGRVSGWLAKY